MKNAAQITALFGQSVDGAQSIAESLKHESVSGRKSQQALLAAVQELGDQRPRHTLNVDTALEPRGWCFENELADLS